MLYGISADTVVSHTEAGLFSRQIVSQMLASGFQFFFLKIKKKVSLAILDQTPLILVLPLSYTEQKVVLRCLKEGHFSLMNICS